MSVISGGGSHSLLLTKNFCVQAFGDNTQGQCNVPPAVQGNARQLSAGWWHSLVLTGDKTV